MMCSMMLDRDELGRLKKLDVLEFDGSPEKFPVFWEAFLAQVHDKPMPLVAKLRYLRSALVGKAATTLDDFTIRGENYVEALELVREIYSDTKAAYIAINKRLAARVPTKHMSGVKDTVIFLRSVLRQYRNIGMEPVDVLQIQHLIDIFRSKQPFELIRKYDDQLALVERDMDEADDASGRYDIYKTGRPLRMGNIEHFLKFCADQARSWKSSCNSREAASLTYTEVRKEEAKKEAPKTKPAPTPPTPRPARGAAGTAGDFKPGRKTQAKHQAEEKRRRFQNKRGPRSSTQIANSDSEESNNVLVTKSNNGGKNDNCEFCDGPHKITECKEIQKVAVEERHEKLRNKYRETKIPVCFHCFGRHFAGSAECKATKCNLKYDDGTPCNKLHHPLLHENQPKVH